MNTLKISSAVLAIVWLGVFPPASARQAVTSGPGFPVVIQNCGRSVTYAAPPKRAVTMNQTATEIMLALGLQDHLVGTAYLDDAILPELAEAYRRIPVLAVKYPSREGLLNARPDFVYAGYISAFATEAAGPREDLARLGAQSYISSSGCGAGRRPARIAMATVYDEIRDIGRIFGVSARAERLIASYQADISATQARIGVVEKPPRVFWYDNGDPPSAGACCGVPDEILRLVGAVNIFKDAPGSWRTVSWEEVIARNPDAVVLVDASWSPAADKRALLTTSNAFASIEAVESQRFIAIDFSASTPGIRIVAAVRKLAASLYPRKIPVSTAAWLTGLAAALAITVTLAVMIGPVPLAPGLIWRVAFDRIAPGVIARNWELYQANIIWEIRFPRVLLGGLVGAGLAVVGATMQSLVRNPLADPYLLGVSSGAGLGAVAVLLFGLAPFGIYSVSLAAFLGALVASTCVYVLAVQPGQFTTGRLVLGGVAVAYVLSALTNFLIYNAPTGEQARDVLFWMLGGLGGARWPQLALPAAVLIVGVALLLAHARTLNVLAVGEEGAATLGVDTNRVRRQGFVLTSLVTGVLVALSGGIGFIGLMVPHIARLAVGADHRRLLPVTALTGAILLIWADVIARTIAAPQELPIGIVTSIVGAPFFIWLMRRTGRARPASR